MTPGRRAILAGAVIIETLETPDLTKAMNRLAELEADIHDEQVLADSYTEQADVHYRAMMRREQERDAVKKLIAEVEP